MLAVLIIFSYQNCIRPKNAEGPVTTQSAGIKLADESIQTVTFLATENIIVERDSKKFTLVSQISYGVDYTTGEVTKTSDANTDQQNYCLTDSLLSELQSIVSVSSVCKKELSSNDQRLCDQVYKPGYALITTNREIFDLGSSSAGCGLINIDLCESTSGDMLKGWFQAVKNQLQQLTCSP